MGLHHADLLLLCRAQTRLYAVPLAHVLETMRPLPVEPMPGAPRFILGLAVIRGRPVPVVDLARLDDDKASQPTRFVTTANGARPVALAVGEVLGIRPIAAGMLQALPPLLQGAAADVVDAIGVLDADLLVMLNCARLVPEEVWARLDARGAA